MGILSIFSSQKTEEHIHQKISELLSELHQLAAMLQKQKESIDHVTHIHRRIDAINAALKAANSIHDPALRRAHLHQTLEAEKGMLRTQKAVAENIMRAAHRVIHLEKKTLHAANALR